MGRLLEKVKARYLELYQAKYGRTDGAFISEGQFVPWDAMIRWIVGSDYDDTPVYLVKRDDPMQMFGIKFKSVSECEDLYRRQFPNDTTFQLRPVALPGMKGYKGAKNEGVKTKKFDNAECNSGLRLDTF